MEVCTGGGAATEWCKLFAAEDETVKIEEIGYVRYTASEYNAAASTMGSSFIDKKYVFVGEADAEDMKCPAHTQETWDAYVKQKEEEEKKKQEELLQQQLQQQLAGLIGVTG